MVVGPSSRDVFGCHVLSHSLLHPRGVSLKDNYYSHSETSRVYDLITWLGEVTCVACVAVAWSCLGPARLSTCDLLGSPFDSGVRVMKLAWKSNNSCAGVPWQSFGNAGMERLELESQLELDDTEGLGGCGVLSARGMALTWVTLWKEWADLGMRRGTG